MANLLCRIQYVNDADPFASTSGNYLEPPRAVTYTFSLHIPIGDQIPAVIRTLRAPHKLDEAALQIYKTYEGGSGDFGTYLDSDLALSDQPDELELLKSDTYVFSFP
uniref:FHOD1 N-terminal GTPase-binding domain-containing protein n=1 Tax=Plectus sambesii TaxID=2011161 RepID=A0A914WI81_9BILA